MFVPYKKNGQPQPFEYLVVTTSETIAMGEALVLSSGKLTKCGATAKPKYIAMAAVTSAAAGTVIPVIRVSPDVIYETQLQAQNTSIAAGALYTLHTDGLQITTTTTNGVAEVVDWDGTAAGSKVRVRF